MLFVKLYGGWMWMRNSNGISEAINEDSDAVIERTESKKRPVTRILLAAFAVGILARID